MSVMGLLARVTAKICEADDRDALFSAIQSEMPVLGFATFNLSAYKSSRRLFMQRPTLTSWSDADIARYDNDDWYDRDPLLFHAEGNGPPKSWQPREWQNSARFGDHSAYVRSLGITGGVTAPLSPRDGAISAITALSFTQSRFSPRPSRHFF